MTNDADVRRLETLWAEDFGDEYVDRNSDVHVYREPLWRRLHENHPFTNVLEVGCNMGANLQWLAQIVEPPNVWGVDINAKALRTARSRLPDVNVVRSPARSLPFRDAMFDLTFCTGVLIHQPPEALPIVMSEIVR
jgi:ubiquinone/menaquinone biosynthesis C-methylase UbiE